MARYGLIIAYFNKCCRESRKTHFVFICKYVCVFLCVRACVRTRLSLAVAEINKLGRRNRFPLYSSHIYLQNITNKY